MRANVFDTFFHKRIYSFRQYDSMDCGPTCLKIIAKYYNKDIEIETFRKWSGIARDGVSLYGLDAAAKRLEFETNPVLISAHDLAHYFEAPCIIHWNQNILWFATRLVPTIFLLYSILLILHRGIVNSP